ncbi:HET-domain-containing protein, partial [Tothia fuscella]
MELCAPISSASSEESYIFETKRLPILREWLDDCTATHDICANSHGKAPLRLLDLGDATTPNALKLIETTDLEPVPYATLSHCWGKDSSKTLKTTQSSVKDHLQAVSLESLPKTYQDAVFVARCLGIRFLWIDSLCFLQDDSTDWTVQVADMANIYQGARLTVAAASSKDSDGGCSFDIPSLAYYADVDDIRFSPLASRAWVLQEQLLSHQVVYFHQRRMFWQCNHHFLQECGQGRRTGLETLRSIIVPRESVLSFGGHSYCRRHLTYPGDRVAAFAGILEFFRARTGYTPIVGFWKESLASDLAW